MGCCSSKQKIVNKMSFVPSNLNPSILIEENFKLIDYTNNAADLKDLSSLRTYLLKYEMSDIRCVRKQNDSPEDHSSLIVISSSLTDSKALEEIWYSLNSLLIQYSLYGFSISLGDTNTVLISAHLKENSMEMIHLPGSDSQKSGGIVEIIDWAYEHKDEKYMSPTQYSELNMGKRLFKFVVALLGKKGP